MSETVIAQNQSLVDLLTYLQPIQDALGGSAGLFALVIIVLSYVAANIIALVVSRVIVRATQKTLFTWDDQVVEIMHRPLFWSVLTLGFLVALTPLSPPALISSVLNSYVATVLVIIWSVFLIRLLKILLKALSLSEHKRLFVQPQTLPLFENLGVIIVVAIAIYFIFKSWHVDMTAWLASAGIVGIAIGFAAKDTLANLFSGVFILADAPYKIGDYVVLDTGERGKVTHIGIRSTRLLTRDDVEITIPNAIMGNTRIINESGGPHEKFRIRVSVGVAYGSDIDQVKDILMGIAVTEQHVCETPTPRVRFRTFGASSLDLDLMCWVANPEVRDSVLDALNTTIYKRFQAEGIEIPYSKQDIYIKEMPPS
ncbi:MAG TPA: mechanosensitive ion channel family protein [Cycloclasticus sp.]|nr:mechanosensitive ion channel family protein [Cycloclasticus sp.]